MVPSLGPQIVTVVAVACSESQRPCASCDCDCVGTLTHWSGVYRAGSALSLNLEAVAPECSISLQYWQKWTAVEVIPILTGALLFLAYLVMNAHKLSMFCPRARRVARLRITDRRLPPGVAVTKASVKAAAKAARTVSSTHLLGIQCRARSVVGDPVPCQVLAVFGDPVPFLWPDVCVCLCCCLCILLDAIGASAHSIWGSSAVSVA